MFTAVADFEPQGLSLFGGRVRLPGTSTRRGSRLPARRARHQRLQLGRHTVVFAGPVDAEWLSPCLLEGGAICSIAPSRDTGWDELLGLEQLFAGSGRPRSGLMQS